MMAGQIVMNVLQESMNSMPYCPDHYTTILVVDDDPVSRKQTANIIEKLGYTALTAETKLPALSFSAPA